MKSPVAYLTDSQFTAMPIEERALHVARSYMGQRELPGNRGPFVARILKAVGINIPAPWCAAFVSICLMEAGAKRSSLPVLAASVRAWRAWSKANSRDALEPKRGHLFYWVNADGTGHVGFVVEVIAIPGGTQVRTIEGNTNAGGPREGDRVAEKTRPVISSMKFINLKGVR